MKIKFNYYHLIAYLLLISLIGWLYETGIVLLIARKFTYRGFFFGYQPLSYYTNLLPKLAQTRIIWGLPVIDMYGYGGIIAIIFFKNDKDHYLKLFIKGFIILSLFELGGSYLSEFLLGKTYWNYTNSPFNFQGRIALKAAIAWGLLAVITIQIFEPLIKKTTMFLEQYKWFKPILITMFIYFIICLITKYFILVDIIPN
ncbi:MAG: putative ABC transporter permease [Bacilli bacterium]